MTVFLDLEFNDDAARRAIDLLSSAMITDDGREYYAVSSEFDASRVDDWVSINVLPHIDWSLARPRAQIRHELLRFLTDARPSAFWDYTPAYDWVATMQLIGPLSEWKAAGWPPRCFDLKQEHIRLGEPTLPPDPPDAHHALADARWNREVYRVLRERGGCW